MITHDGSPSSDIFFCRVHATIIFLLDRLLGEVGPDYRVFCHVFKFWNEEGRRDGLTYLAETQKK